MIKAFLSDFDGTLVTEDILDIVCGIAGKEEESRKINEEFHAGIRKGVDNSIIPRINFLRGVTIEQINHKLSENSYLMEGAQDLFTFLKKSHITTILHSGNIMPVLSYYKDILQIDYALGNSPIVENNVIQGIFQSQFPTDKNFKRHWVESQLRKLDIDPKDTVALGDSPADLPIFEIAGASIAINPKHGIEQHATYTVSKLSDIFPIIEKLHRNN